MSNTKKVYQLSAVGNSVNGWRFKMKSKSVFFEQKDAEAYIPEFKRLCCDRTFFECAEEEGLKITFLELNLH